MREGASHTHGLLATSPGQALVLIVIAFVMAASGGPDAAATVASQSTLRPRYGTMQSSGGATVISDLVSPGLSVGVPL